MRVLYINTMQEIKKRILDDKEKKYYLERNYEN